MVKNKRGWMEIIEAVVAILLVAGVILIMVNKGYIGKEDISEKVYNTEISILREIQTNDTLRQQIAEIENTPLSWEEEEFPELLKDKISERTPDYLECQGKICELEEICNLENIEVNDVYAQSGIISATLESGEVYKKLVLFCWSIGS